MNSFIANILRTDYVEINNPVKWIGIEPYCEQTTIQAVKWIGIEPYCETDEPSSSFDNSFDQSFG
jgi:hypothetical protein